MPFTPKVPPAPGLCVPVRQGDGPGEQTRVAVRGTRWRRVARGLHVDSAAPAVVEQRVLEQASRLGDRGAATGWAALRLAGAAYADGLDRHGAPRRVPLVAGGSGVRSDGEALVVREALEEGEVVVRQGVRCVSPERAVAHEVCRLTDPREAVVVVDMACAAELTSLRRLRAWLAEQPGRRDRGRLLRALLLADEGSRSPMETRMRLAWQLDAGRGRPLCNRQVLDESGRLLGVADLVDPVHAVVGEYDGQEHRSRARHRRDVRREADFRAAGLEVVTVVAGDLDEPWVLMPRIHQAYGRAGQTPRRFRVGDAVDPATGRPGPCLDDRLALRERVAQRGPLE